MNVINSIKHIMMKNIGLDISSRPATVPVNKIWRLLNHNIDANLVDVIKITGDEVNEHIYR